MQKRAWVLLCLLLWAGCSSFQRLPSSQSPCPISLFFPNSSNSAPTAWEVVESQLPKLDPSEERILALFAFESSERRSRNTSAHLAFYGYKNVSTGPRVIVDFSRQDPTRISLELQRIPELQRAHPRFPLTTHEYRMLRLRKGDRIQFEDRQFRLGSFLGAGNTTHIWELADDPTKALRLPFLSAGLINRAQVESQMHQIDAGRLWAFRYVEGIKKLKNAVRVLDVDPLYRWVLVERIIHDMKWGATGYDIALKLFPPSKDLSLPTTWIEQAQAAAKQGRAWDTKIWELLLLARENGHIPPLAEALPNVPDSLKEAWKKAHTGPKKTSENFGLLRQYVLEKDTLTWRVLDTN